MEAVRELGAEVPAQALQLLLVLALPFIALGAVALGVFETSIAKMRVFRVPNFLGAALMLALLGVLLRFVSRGM